MTQVFISYSRKDISFINRLAADLKNAGLDIWYDVSRIAGGARWRSEIENALRNSQYVIVVLSPDSIVSEWVEREFLFSSNLKRKIIPIMYRACEVPLNYVDLNYIDVQGENYAKNFEGLLRALNVGSPPTLPTSQAGKSRSRWNTASVALIGGGGLLLVVLVGLVLMKGFLAAAPPVPTSSGAGPFSEPGGITDARGVRMVLVPAGEFTMGSRGVETALAECQTLDPSCDQTWFEDELTPHSVTLDAFYIDVYEVTNSQYAACVDSGICLLPTDTTSDSRSSYYGNAAFEDYPVIFVDWNMANTYCSWRSARLPTEAEWEKAARGTDERTYPWGEEIDDTRANYNNNIGDTSRVGSYESNKSPYGLYDMAGNVWEWVADYYSDTYYSNSPSLNPPGPESGSERVLRGGSWYDPAYLNRTTTRLKQVEPVDNNYGFRCAKNSNP